MNQPENTNEQSRWREIVERHLRGDISPSEAAELESMLLANRAARDLYRRACNVEAALRDQASKQTPLESEVVPVEQSGRPMPWLAMAATLVVMAALAVILIHGLARNPAPIVRVTEVAGVVSWRGASGEAREHLAFGDRLPSGAFSLAGEGATLQLKFGDGTKLSLGGPARAVLLDNGQKQVTLQSGLLSADVKLQPPGRPLLVSTPTAQLQVLGTSFAVSAEPARTTLNVTHGQVRMERLSDGATVEVRSRQGAVASLNATVEFTAKDATAPSVHWRRRFDEPPPHNWRGQWRAADGVNPARSAAVPCLAGRLQDGTPVIQYGVTARGSGGHLVTVTPASVFRMRCRIEDSGPLRVMLGMQKPDGSFGGNFEASIPGDAVTAGPGGWREIELPVSEFRPLVPKFSVPPANAQVSLVFVTTYDRPADLEVAELAIEESTTP